MAAKEKAPLSKRPRTIAELEAELAARTAERDHGLARERALTEVLEIINASPGDLAPVLGALLEKAVRLCEADFGILWRFEDGLMRLAATHNVPAAFVEYHCEPMRPGPDSGPGRLMRGDGGFATPNVLEFPPYQAGVPEVRAIVDLAGARSLVIAPLRRDGAALGAITIYRKEIRPFSANQFTLLQNFAAQAVIAMENARLIAETREALDQQTATAEVLQVINSSPGDLAPVFEAILEKALSLCAATYRSLQLYDGDKFRAVAVHGLPESLADRLREGYSPGPNNPMRGLLEGEPFVHVVDMAEIDDPVARRVVELGAVRTLLSVALRKDDMLLGQIVSARKEVRPFAEKEIALFQNFAAQAVIAIENARLLGELRTRTVDLQESLEYQTATSDVLQVISRSTFDLQPVFDTLMASAARLCRAEMVGIAIRRDDGFHYVATSSITPEFDTFIRTRPFLPGRETMAGRVALEGRIIQIADTTADPEYRLPEVFTLGNIRTLLGVPLLREGQTVGVISLCRQRVEPFSERQIELVRTFADQAVIAIENTRLLTETRQALEQQTATAEVLQIINSSPGDLAPVFHAMLDKATRLCEATYGNLYTYDGQRYHSAAVHGPAEFVEWRRQRGPYEPGGFGLPLDRIVAGERIVAVDDAPATEAYGSSPGFRELVDTSGLRSGITVGLRKDDALLGAITVYRTEVRPFSDKQIALLQNFAAQAVIAMENARLLGELRRRTGDLEESLEYQTATSDVLKVISRSTFDLQPVLDTLVATATRLCDAEVGHLTIRQGDAYRYVATLATDPTSRPIPSTTCRRR